MLLISDEIKTKAIVDGAVEAGKRGTTYDATVGIIIKNGAEQGEKYTLKPREIVWAVSAENFCLPLNVTGLATLRTTWTHEGILALNVGVVDPGWNGPLSAALVNFSSKEFTIEKGAGFLRMLFHEHKQSSSTPITVTPATYKDQTLSRSRLFSDSFLSMDQLVSEVSGQIYGAPRWINRLTFVGLLLAALSIFAPLAWSVWSDSSKTTADLQSRIGVLEKELEELHHTRLLERRLEEIERRTAPQTAPPASELNGSWVQDSPVFLPIPSIPSFGQTQIN